VLHLGFVDLAIFDQPLSERDHFVAVLFKPRPDARAPTTPPQVTIDNVV
jgi:hypothetical protein